MKLREAIYYSAKAISLALNNILKRKRKRSDSAVIREYSDQVFDWALYEGPEQSLGIRNSRLKSLTNAEKRHAYVDLLKEEIREYDVVLEAGCGGGVNVILLNQLYPRKTFFAFDFIQNRVTSAAEIARKKNLNISFSRSDIRHIDLLDKSVDATYTMLVLEQLASSTMEALKEIIRVTRKKIILLEPCYEFSNFAQKQYLIYKDYTQTVKRDLETLQSEEKIKIMRMEKLESYHNPLNAIGLFVLEPSHQV